MVWCMGWLRGSLGGQRAWGGTVVLESRWIVVVVVYLGGFWDPGAAGFTPSGSAALTRADG